MLYLPASGELGPSYQDANKRWECMVMASWDLWVDPITPLVCPSGRSLTIYCLVNSSQYLQVELIVGYVLKSDIFGLVREVCFGVACWSSAWDMANELSVKKCDRCLLHLRTLQVGSDHKRCLMKGIWCNHDGLCDLQLNSLQSVWSNNTQDNSTYYT